MTERSSRVSDLALPEPAWIARRRASGSGDVGGEAHPAHRRQRRRVGVAGLAQRHGDRRDHRLRGQPAPAGEMTPQRAAHHREHHVVDGHLVTVGDAHDGRQRDRQRRDRASAADRDVERGPRGEPERRCRARPRAGVAPERATSAVITRASSGSCLQRAHRLHGGRPDGGSQQPSGSRVLALRRVLARRHGAGHGRGVEQRVREGHARRPVQRRVMDLGVERELARGETLDHVQAPERAIALERPRVQPRDRRLPAARSVPGARSLR